MCRLLYGVAQVPSMLREWGWGKAKEEVRPNTPPARALTVAAG